MWKAKELKWCPRVILNEKLNHHNLLGGDMLFAITLNYQNPLEDYF
jgi:hypothetical protein